MADHEAAKPEIEIENAPAAFKSVIWKQLLSVCQTCKNAKNMMGRLLTYQ